MEIPWIALFQGPTCSKPGLVMGCCIIHQRFRYSQCSPICSSIVKSLPAKGYILEQEVLRKSLYRMVLALSEMVERIFNALTFVPISRLHSQDAWLVSSRAVDRREETTETSTREGIPGSLIAKKTCHNRSGTLGGDSAVGTSDVFSALHSVSTCSACWGFQDHVPLYDAWHISGLCSG